MTEILTILNFRVFGVSAHQNALIIGSPSPPTICGASLALCRKLGVKFISSACVMHEFTLHQGHAKFVPHYVNEKSASTSDIVTGDARLSLLIQFQRADTNVPDEDEIPNYVIEDEKAFRGYSIRKRTQRLLRNVAGGRVIDPPALDDITLHDDEESALSAVRQFDGSILLDRSDLLTGCSDPLDAIVTHMTKISDEDESRGWLVPIHIGFQGIEPPTIRLADRKKTDEEIPHSFVECISSMGEYVGIRQMRTLENCFWSYHHNASERTYYVSAAQVA